MLDMIYFISMVIGTIRCYQVCILKQCQLMELFLGNKIYQILSLIFKDN